MGAMACNNNHGASGEAGRVLVVLGATASGKTRLGVRLAAELDGEVISADSRQVYRGLDLGAGKDLDDYEVGGRRIPCHLIDVVDLGQEFSVFDYQKRFYQVFEELTGRGVLPVVVGGTGLYLEAVLKGYRMAAVPEDPDLRAELAGMPHEALVARLIAAKGKLHNTTDLTERDRLIRAIEIVEYSKGHEPAPAPAMNPLILGTKWDRAQLRQRIRERLEQRLEAGMIEEVQDLHDHGVPWKRLERLGLEYRFIAEFLQGKIQYRNDLFQKLYSAICHFAKRQDTWFRRMERNGADIHWIPQGRIDIARQAVSNTFAP